MNTLRVIVILLFALGAGAAAAATCAPAASCAAADLAAGGFWSGLLDGFLSLLKLLLSPVFDMAIVPEQLGAWDYKVGYYLGVLGFAGVAGAAASSEAYETI